MFAHPTQASTFTKRFAQVLCMALMCLHVGQATAQVDPPGRVGRMADFQGTVWVFEHELGDWAAALRNRPLTTGDRVSTAPDARAELRIGSSVVRIHGRSELELLQLDDHRVVLHLHSGSAALRVRSREMAQEFELHTAEARFKPQRAGHFRIDRQDDVSFATALQGELMLDDGQTLLIATGQRVEFWREGRERLLRQRWVAPAQDDFTAWLAREDQQEQRSVATRHVSPEMTGAEELDRHGRWESHPEYGSLWVPIGVSASWAPFRFGTWVWLRPWGWTWVDAQPWGFAPFHYGRWVMHRGRWCWAPGSYTPRPSFSPALVSWVGTPHGGGHGHVVIGTPHRHLPAPGWVPLGPRENYRAPHPRPGYDHNGRWPRADAPHDRGGHPNPGQPMPHRGSNPPSHAPAFGATPIPAAPPMVTVPQAPHLPPVRATPPPFGHSPRHAAPAASAVGPVPPRPVGPPLKPGHDRHDRHDKHERASGDNAGKAEREPPRVRTPEARQGGRQGERENFR
jgi:FecR protein